MKTELAIFLSVAQTVLFLGCGEKDVATASPESHAGVCQETQPDPNEPIHEGVKPPTNGLDQTLKELDADFLSITNYVYAEWVGARDAALRMRDKIMSLPRNRKRVCPENVG